MVMHSIYTVRLSVLICMYVGDVTGESNSDSVSTTNVQVSMYLYVRTCMNGYTRGYLHTYMYVATHTTTYLLHVYICT